MGLKQKHSTLGNPEESDDTDADGSKTKYIRKDGAHAVHDKCDTPSHRFDSQKTSDDEDSKPSGDGDDKLSNDKDNVPSDTSIAAG